MVIVVLVPVLIAGMVTGGFLKSKAERMYHERMSAELAHVNMLIAVFVDSARMNLNYLCSLPLLSQAGPGYYNRYMDTAVEPDGPGDPQCA
jgi:riboflavin transporter FmnP